MTTPPPGMMQGGPPPQADLPPNPGAMNPPADLGAMVPEGDKTALRDAMRQVTLMTSDLDKALTGLSRVFGEDGGQEVGEAKKLLAVGLRKFLSAKGQVPSLGPNEAGSPFPGGGFSSNVQE